MSPRCARSRCRGRRRRHDRPRQRAGRGLHRVAPRTWATAHPARSVRCGPSPVTWTEAGHDGPIPLESSLDWATSTASADPCNPARRLAAVRGFLRHLSALDGATEVPAPGLLGPTGHRTPPHVYSDREIGDLLHAAAGLAPAGGLRPHCYVTLFGLIACTGLRICEALALTCGDVDLVGGMLTVRAGKRGRTRLVPLHPSALTPLRDYAADRERRFGPPSDGAAFFRTDRSDRISYNAANQHVHRAAPAAGLDRGRPHPRAARARPAAPHGGAAHPGLARRGRRRRPQDRGAGHLPRSRRGARRLLVPVRRPRADEHRRRPLRGLRLPPRQVGHEIPADRLPAARAGLLPAAPGRPARRQRPHRRGLPRRVRAAARFRSSSEPASHHPR